MRNVSDKICRENQKHTFCVEIFFYENLSVYKITKKNIVQPDTPQMKIWRMRIASWISKATDIHSEYVILIAFPQQQRLHERASKLRYTYIACTVLCDEVLKAKKNLKGDAYLSSRSTF
jgi:hypothetical protein